MPRIAKATEIDMTIKKIGRIQDKRTETYLEILEFPISATERKRAEWPPSIVNEPKSLEKSLRDKGAMLPKEGVRELLSAVAATDCPKEFVYEARAGWSDDRTMFVLPDGAIGPGTKNILGINRGVTGEDTGRLEQAGTWQQWKDAVASGASFSSILMVGTSVAFAAPLLAIVDEGSFSFCISARTRTGKTLATLCGSSVIGVGKSENLIAWTITKARLDQRLAEYNDSIFPIDDFESMGGDDRAKYTDIRGLAYRLAQGVGRARSAVYNISNSTSNARWRCIALTSSERPIKDLAKAAGQERQPGEALRLIDLPALVEGEEHIFDRMPADLSGKSDVQWRTDVFAAIREGCANNCGSPYRRYITFLMKAGEKLKPAVEQHRRTFIRAVADSCDDDQTRDLARKFSLIFAGAMLAKAAKLVDWAANDVLQAFAKLYVAARNLLPNEGELKAEGIQILAAKIASFSTVSPLPDAPALPAGACASWQGSRKTYWGKNTCLIKRDVFDASFASRLQRNLVERWMVENRLVTLAQSRGAAGGHQSRPKEQHQWPDGERRRSFEIRWRGQLADGKAV